VPLYRKHAAEGFASPEDFGAIGNAQIDPITGLVTGAIDTTAVNRCATHCWLTGKEMVLISAYRYAGTFDVPSGVTIRGTSPITTGVYIDVDRENEGFHILGTNTTHFGYFISVRIPLSIQNGQGGFGTCVTVGAIYYPVLERLEGESATAYATRSTPPLVAHHTFRNMVFLRRPGGSGHATATVGRCAHVSFVDCEYRGWSSSTGRHSNGNLTHWGGPCEPFLADPDGVLIEPLIQRRPDDVWTFHPHDIRVVNPRLRNCVRPAGVSAAYNYYLSGVEIDGQDDGVQANGCQLLLLVGGDDADAFAHPDDAGKVFRNIVVDGVTAYNMDGLSPNPAGTGLIDFPGYSTSKYDNADGTLARDDPRTITYGYDIPPLAVSPGPGNTHTVDIAVAGALVANSANAGAWHSKISTDADYPVKITATVPVDGTVRVLITNTSTTTTYNFAPGTLNAYVGKLRKFRCPVWTFEFANMNLYGIGETGYVFNFRNLRAHGKVRNINTSGLRYVDGALLQQLAGKITFENCFISGTSLLDTVEGVKFRDCRLETTNALTLTVLSTAGFERGDRITGATSALVGYVTEIVNGTTMRVRVLTTPWRIWTPTEVLSNGAGASTTLTSQAAYAQAVLEVTGDVSALTLGASLSVNDNTLTLEGPAGRSIRPGDAITIPGAPGGVVYARDYHDDGESVINITRSPVAAASGTALSLDRRSRDVELEGTDLIGADRGLEVSNGDVKVSGGVIRDFGLYGVLANTDSVVSCEDVTFSNGGLRRVAIEPAANTRDALPSNGGTLHLNRCKHINGERIGYNVVAGATASGGSCRNAVFVPAGEEGAPVSGNLNVTNPQADGGRFVVEANRDRKGLLVGPGVRIATATFDAASLAPGSTTTTTVAVFGCAFGDDCSATLSISQAGLVINAYVSAAGIATVQLRNDTAGPVDLTSATLTVFAVRR
jgi:hypothetical protein